MDLPRVLLPVSNEVGSQIQSFGWSQKIIVIHGTVESSGEC